MSILKKAAVLAIFISSLLYIGCGMEVGDPTGSSPRPLAEAGASQQVPVGSLVTLDGAGSTSTTGGGLVYNWAFTSVAEGSALTSSSLSGTVSPTFTPDKPGTYIISLVVSDGLATSFPDYVHISAGAPIADAGSSQTVEAGEPVTLDGSGSSLYGGGTEGLTYAWTFDSVPGGSSVDDASLSDASAINPTFTPDKVGNYGLSLIVNDSTSDSEPDTVTVYATNTMPVADAGPDQVATTSTLVTLDGSGSSDADGDSITYLWSFEAVPGGSSITDSSLSNALAVDPTFTPDLDGAYNVKLIVYDGIYNSNADYVLIASGVPLADAGPGQTMKLGNTVTLDGSGSTDASGGGLTYAWSFDSVPGGSSINDLSLSDATAVGPTFTPDVLGDYVLSLVVTETGVDSAPDTVKVTASRLIADLSFASASLGACVNSTAAGYGATYASQLHYLNCSSMGIDSIGGIGNLTSLTYLYMNNNTIEDISELSGMTGLYDLRMNMNLINDISALSGMTSLYYLDLFYNDISEITELSGLSNLTDLNLSYNNGLSNISGISSMTGLYTLGLSGTSVTDLSDISSMTELRSLGLAYTSLSSVSELSGLTKLTVLNLNQTGLSDISGLSGMGALEILHLEDNSIANISALSGMANMTDLQLRNNTGITDISALAGMDNLGRLDLHHCAVSNISALSGKYGLTNLDLNSNNASDISPLAGMSNISALSLQGNGISDISVLQDMTDMRLLYISGNSITDISAIQYMTKLSQLYISGNTIVDVTPLSYATSLLDLLLGNNSITTGVDTLAALTSARDINLIGNDSIPCDDLTTLTTALGAGVVTEPSTCIP